MIDSDDVVSCTILVHPVILAFLKIRMGFITQGKDIVPGDIKIKNFNWCSEELNHLFNTLLIQFKSRQS
jgi:hypothetical protein